MSPPKKLDVFADSPVALSGFQGQVKKPEISGFGPLCRSHLKSLRLTGYETCRWPDGSNSLGLDCLRLWKKGNVISLNSSRRNQLWQKLRFLYFHPKNISQIFLADSPVALSGFRGQVKKPDCSGLEPLRRSHLKSLRLTGYETCRWPDGGSSTKSKISDLPPNHPARYRHPSRGWGRLLLGLFLLLLG